MWEERRLYSLRAGEEDSWRELWVWAYAFFVGVWLLISPHIPAKKFPWHIKVRQLRFLNRHPARTFENFTAADKRPPKPPEPFQLEYKSQRPHLYRRIVTSAVLRHHRFILGAGALALTLAWWLRSTYYIHFKMGWVSLLPETVRTNFAAGAGVHRILLPLSAFILSLYIVFHVHRLYTIMDLAWKVQGSIYDFAILLSTLLMPHASDVRVQNALFRLHRHLNLLHVLVYEEVSQGVKNVTSDAGNLYMSGLVDKSEFTTLEKAENRIMIVFAWLSELTNRLVEARLVPKVLAPAIQEALTELLESVELFHAASARLPPVPVAHLMQIVADMICLLTPALLAHIFRPHHPSSPTYFWPWAGSMAVALIYQGMMSFAEACETPFDDHTDGLNPDWALMTTERQTFGCLAGAQVGGPAMSIEPLNLLRPRTEATAFGEPPPFVGAVGAGAMAAVPQAGSVSASTAVANALAPFAPSQVAVQQQQQQVAVAARQPAPTTGSIDASPDKLPLVAVTSGVAPVRKEQVPLEAMPPEAPYAQSEQATITAATQPQQSGAEYGQWGTLDQELLQATRAALLVPREITLDDVSLERLETVTARPLSELAAALLRAEATSGATGTGAAPLALTETPHAHELGGRVGRAAHHSAIVHHDQESTSQADEVKDLIGKYHHELRHNSDMRAQLAAVHTGLAGTGLAGAAPARGPVMQRGAGHRSALREEPGLTNAEPEPGNESNTMATC